MREPVTRTRFGFTFRRATAVGLLLPAVLLSVGPRARVSEPAAVQSANEMGVPVAPEDLDAWLDRAEDLQGDVYAHARKTVRWANSSSPGRTQTVVIYLHGFSATRQEVAPLADSVATRIGANLYYARFAGHGRPGAAMGEPNPDRWAVDLMEAMAIAERLGDRVVLMGTSTGATLATWIATRAEYRDRLDALLLLSPNFGVQAPGSWVFRLGYGTWLANRVAGRERSWEPANEAQGRFWTTSYPTSAVATMLAWVYWAEDVDFGELKTSTWIGYSPADQVVNPESIRDVFDAFGAATKEIVAFDPGDDPSNHILAGDAMAPDMTLPVAELILAFLDRVGR